MKGVESSQKRTTDERDADGGDAAAVDPADTEGAGPGEEVEERAPGNPSQLPRRAWWAVLRGTAREFQDDELLDRAAALTYYGILSLFPTLLVLVSSLGFVGETAITQLLDTVRRVAPGSTYDVINNAVEQLRANAGVGSVMAIVGLATALWASSGYIAAFIRVSNVVYDVPEGRPTWKLLPLRLAMTAALVVLAGAGAVIVVFTGGLARRTGTALGVGDTAMAVWSVAKWPLLALLMTGMIALLYWAAPNAKSRGFRWVSLGSFLALVLWLLASVGFAFYVAHFGSYNKIYGTLAGVIVFLIWLWISNVALLLGLEFDAETIRQRAIAGGLPEDEELYIEPRDTREWTEKERRELE